MNEWIIILAVILSSALFAAGGTHIKGVGGQKWLRRFVLPVVLSATAYKLAPLWALVGFTATLCAFLHLGYGDRCSWPKRAFIFAGYGLSSLWIGWSWWAMIVGPVCCLLFFLSNLRYTAKSFVWKLCELSFGFLIACAFVGAILSVW